VIFRCAIGSGSRYNKYDYQLGGCSGVWLPPPKYRNKEACNQEHYPETDLYPVLDRRGISMSNPIRASVYKIRSVKPNFSLDKAIPQLAAAIDAQINCDDASDNFIKEKPHSNIRSSSMLPRVISRVF
jgi:hypothetical protein